MCNCSRLFRINGLIEYAKTQVANHSLFCMNGLIEGVLSHGARTVRAFSGVSGDFTQWRGPQQTTLAGVPKCLWMVTKGLWVISGVSALQGFFCYFLVGLMVFIRPSVPNSAPVGPCWYTRNFFFSLMVAICPSVPNSAPVGPCWYTRNFFFSLMVAICPSYFLVGLMVFIRPSVPNSAPVGPCWYTRNFFF